MRGLTANRWANTGPDQSRCVCNNDSSDNIRDEDPIMNSSVLPVEDRTCPLLLGGFFWTAIPPLTQLSEGNIMSIKTTTHLNFRGTARRALEFYQTVFGGRVMAVAYSDLGMPKEAPGADKVVFGQLENEDGFRVMAYDIPGHDDTDPAAIGGSTHRENGATITDRTFFQSVRGETLDDVEGYWSRLSDGAYVIEPLAASAWTPGFGMLTDKFGVTWVLDVQTPDAG